jgi:hypothetical protein
VIKKWGRSDIVGDYVRLIRTLRPDVLVTMNIQGRGGDRAHEATTVLVREAYLASGNAAMFPEQIRDGLRPWQPKKLYFSAGFGGGGRGGRGGRGVTGPTAPAEPPAGVRLTRVNTSAYDPLLGRTYAEIGADARSNHKCQGAGGGVPALPGFGGGRGPGAGQAGGPTYQLIDSRIPGQMQKDESGIFDAIDLSLAGIAQYAGANPPDALKSGLAAVVDQAERATKAFAAGDDAGTVAPVEAGLSALRALRAQLPSMRLSDDARYEIDFRLKNKERDYQDAVVAAHGLSFDAVADDGLVIGGQPVRLSLVGVNRGATEVSVSDVTIAGFDGTPSCAAGSVAKDAAYTCSADARVPPNARLTTPYFTDDYWKSPGQPGDQQVREWRAVWRAVCADAVPCHVSREGRQRRRHQRTAGAIPLREGHLQRRQAHGVERRAGVFSARDAAAGGDAGVGDGGCRDLRPPANLRPRYGPRSSRIGDERHQRCGAGDRDVGAAGGLAVDAGQRRRRVRARGRSAIGPFPGVGARVGESRRVHAARGRDVDLDDS